MAIAVFICTWIDSGVCIVAIGIVRQVAGRLIAIDIRDRWVTKTVIVGIRVPSRDINGIVFINLPITIVIVPVTVLVCHGVGVRVTVVAIC